jgi:hypothetical protein
MAEIGWDWLDPIVIASEGVSAQPRRSRNAQSRVEL